MQLKYAYYITCTNVIKDPNTGVITELRSHMIPDSKGGWSKDGRRVKGTSHWISNCNAVPAEFRLYDRLFTKPDPDSGESAI